MTDGEALIMDVAVKLEQLKAVDFLSFFSDETLEKLARSCEVLTLSAYQILFEEGDESNAMYIILSGELLVYKKRKVIARRKPGEYIGEMGLIESKPRSATIRTETETQLLEITSEKFQKEFSSNSESLIALLKTLSSRARENLKIFETHDLAKDRVPELKSEDKLEHHVKYLMQEAGLTSREADVARLICDGLSDKEVAKKLELSHHTVKDHLKKIFAKFRVHARSQLVSLMYK